MKRNITISYVLTYLYHSWFWMGTWVFYYLRFTDYRGIGVIESVMISLTLLLDIPAGVITDKIGKKKALFFAFLFSGLGNMIFGFSTSFYTLIFSVSIYCLGSAFYSGTLEALQFDSLKSTGDESLFNKVASRSNTFLLISFAVASVLGGFLYNILPGLPFILVGIMHFIGAVITLWLVEPKIVSEKSPGLGSFFLNQVKGFQELTKTKNIRKYIIILSFVGVVVVICSQTLDDLLGVEFGFTPIYFGIISAIIYILSSIVSHFTPQITEYFGEWVVVVIASVIIAVTLVISPWLGIAIGTAVLCMRSISQNIFDITSSIIINHQIDSSYRTTTLSTFNFIKNLPYAFTAIILGSAMNGLGAKNFAFYLGMVLFIFLTAYFSPSIFTKVGIYFSHGKKA